MARLYTWMRTKRIALAFCALTLLGAAGVWALQERQQPAGGPSALPAAGAAAANGNPLSWPYEITEHSSMPRDLSFAEAKADFEQMVGEEVDMVGTAGAWAEISTPGTLLDVPLDVFEGPPPPEITVAYDFAIYFGAYGAAFERVSGVAYELVFVGEFSAAYAPPPWPEIVQWGDELAPHPDLSAALAQAFTDMGEGGSIYVMPSAMLRVEDPYVSTWQPVPIDTWRAGGNFLYEFKVVPTEIEVTEVGEYIVPGSNWNAVRYKWQPENQPPDTVDMEVLRQEDGGWVSVRSIAGLPTALVPGQDYAEYRWNGCATEDGDVPLSEGDYKVRLTGRWGTGNASADEADAFVEEWLMGIIIEDRPGGEETLVTGPDETSVEENLEVRVSLNGGAVAETSFDVEPNTPTPEGPAGNERGCLVTPKHTFYTTPRTPYDIRYEVVMEQKTAFSRPPEGGLKLHTVVDGTLNAWDMDPDTEGRQTRGIWRFGITSVNGQATRRELIEVYE